MNYQAVDFPHRLFVFLDLGGLADEGVDIGISPAPPAVADIFKS